MTGQDAIDNLETALKECLLNDTTHALVSAKAISILLKHYLKRNGYVNCGSFGLAKPNCGCWDCKSRREY